jgi:ABC-type glycerol-3-phosphate transport system substrate-binding protein
MTRFQIILTAVFGAFIFIGVLVFSMYRGSSGEAATVVVWGTIPQIRFNNIIDKTALYQSKQYKVQYVEKSEETFDTEFIEALASGAGPDLFLLPSDKIIKHRNKIFPVPYEFYTQRQFKDSFVEGAEVYLAPEGVLAMPVYADPLVMYWNRNLFTNARITQPPKYWDEFYNLTPLLTQKDSALNISKSLVAFGEFANITNAKKLVLNLAMQAGTPVTYWGAGEVTNSFADTLGKPTIPADAAINFYTEFANPAKASYSWNRSLPNSTNYFLGGDLALYFGFADEIRLLQIRNPNLNFDVALVPISREGGTDTSIANFYGFAITRSSRNPNAAFAVASILSGAEAARAFSEDLLLPPVRRDLLAERQTDSYMSVFYESAIRSKTWLDPDPQKTDAIFKNMIESITSGRARTGEAITRVHREINELLAQ